MRKIIVILTIVAAIIFATYMVAFGFVKNTTVYMGEYEVSNDGNTVRMEFFVASPVGYIRQVKTHVEGDKVCCDFYQAFGGISGSIGSMEKYEFTVDVDDSVNEICFYRGTSGYEQVLVRNDDGQWIREVK